MNPGLLLLVRRTARGKLCYLLRRARTLKGGLSIGAGVLLMAVVAASQFLAMSAPGGAPPAPPVEAVRLYFPPVLVVLTVLGLLSGRSLYFTQPEVDFLFPAPVGRRELLVYSLLARLDVQVLSGLWASIFVVRLSPAWGSAVAAVVLSFVFMYVTAQALGVAWVAAEPWLPRAARRLLTLGAGAAAVAVVAGAVAGAPAGTDLDGRLARVADHPLVRGASIVTRPFAELFVAEGFAAALPWLLACVAVIAAEVGLMLAFDVAYTERSLALSRRVHEKLRRMRASGGTGMAAAPTFRRARVPALGFLGAAAPLARRQLLELARNPKALFPAVLMGAIWVAAIVAGGADAGSAAEEAGLALGVGVLLPILFTAHLGYDFRRDLDRMPLLKSLPLGPMTVAVGQLFAVALAFAVLQMAMATTISAVSGSIPPAWLPGLMVVVPPLTWAAIAVDNALFLLMPYRVSTGGEPNMQFVGKTMLAMFLKLVVLSIVVGVAVAAAFGVYAATGASVPAAVVAGALALAACCVPLTWAVARAFAAFDLARDVPAES